MKCWSVDFRARFNPEGVASRLLEGIDVLEGKVVAECSVSNSITGFQIPVIDHEMLPWKYATNSRLRVLKDAAVGTSSNGSIALKPLLASKDSDKVLCFVELSRAILADCQPQWDFPSEWCLAKHDGDRDIIQSLLVLIPIGAKLTLRMKQLEHGLLRDLEADDPMRFTNLQLLRSKGIDTGEGGKEVNAHIVVKSPDKILVGDDEIVFVPDENDNFIWHE